jgi:phosphonate transport system substrate-binding protein
MRTLLGRCLLLLLSLASAPALSEAPAYLFGVLNQQSPQLTAERWLPVLRQVSGKAGVNLQLRMGPTVAETDARMGRGEFDFMYTNHNFQRQYDKVGYRVIARAAGEAIRCAFVVPQDSPLKHLADLRGKRIGYPSADAFVAYAVPKAMLKETGLHTQAYFAGNQDAVLTALRFRETDAAAVNSGFLKQYEARHGVRFRVIHLSDGYPDMAVIVHPRVPAEVADGVRAALLGMAADPAAKAILSQAGFTAFEAATDRDYAEVRRVYHAIDP